MLQLKSKVAMKYLTQRDDLIALTNVVVLAFDGIICEIEELHIIIVIKLYKGIKHFRSNS
jgi:hypothetical protein